MLLQDGQGRDGAALPFDRDLMARHQAMLADHRRVLAAGRRLEAIAEPGVHHRRGLFVEVNVDQSPPPHEQRTQIIDAMGVVGMLVGVENAVEPIDLGVEQLLAQIRRGVDQDPRDAAGIATLDQERRAAAAVFRIVGIAGAPAQRRPRHAAGRSAAENGEFQRHAAGAPSLGG